MINLKPIIFIVLFLLVLNACKDDNISPEEESTAINKSLNLPEGTITMVGNPPSPSNDQDAPEIENLNPDFPGISGENTNLVISYNTVENIAGVFVQVEGAEDYFNVPFSSDFETDDDQLELPICIPSEITEGEFYISYCIYDEDGLVSNVIRTRVFIVTVSFGGTVTAKVDGKSFDARGLEEVGSELDLEQGGTFQFGILSADQINATAVTANSISLSIFGSDFNALKAGDIFSETEDILSVNLLATYAEIVDGETVVGITTLQGKGEVKITLIDRSSRQIQGSFSFSGKDDNTKKTHKITDGFFDAGY